MDGARRTLAIQGIFYLLTGALGLLHISSFMRVTGPKVDTWLVKTVSALVCTIGVGLLLHSRRDRVLPEVTTIALGSAVGLTWVDIYYVAKGRIRKVYLLDAAAETLLSLALLRGLRPRDLGRNNVAQRRLLVEGQKPGVPTADVDAAD